MKKYLIPLAIFFAPFVAFATISQTIDLTAPYTWTGKQTITSASTTNLTIGNYASTSKFFADGLVTCNSENMLTWAAGVFGCESDTTGAGGTWPFTTGQDYAGLLNTQSTTSPLWIKNNLLIASTTLFTQASTTMLTNTGTTWLTSISNKPLAVDSTGKVYGAATTTFSTGLTYSGGAVTCDTASASVFGCLSAANWATFNGKAGFSDLFTLKTNYGTTTMATTTPVWFQGGIFASSTSGNPTLVVTQGDSGAAAVFLGGNVGIGSTTPQKSLVVQTTVNGGQITFDSGGATNRIMALTSSAIDVTTAANNVADLILQATGDDIGVGTTTPIRKFSVYDNTVGFSGVFYGNNAGGAAVALGANTSAGSIQAYDSDSLVTTVDLVLQAAGSEVGIGTTSPQWALTAANATKPQLALVDTTKTSNAWTFRSIANSLFIATSTYSATSTISAVRIDPNGAVYLPSSGASASAQTGYWCFDTAQQLIRDSVVCLVSALKYKKDVQNLDVGLDDLLTMRPVSYLKKDPLDEKDSHRQMGFIADEVAENPRLDEMLVTYDSEGEVRGFRYEQFTALLAKSIKQLNEKVENIQTDKAVRSVEENYQNFLLGLLILGFIYQRRRINKLTKK